MQWDESANICNDYKLSAPPENLDLIWTQDSRSGLSRVVTQEHGNAGPCISLRQLPCLFLLRKRADDQHAFCFVASLVQVDPAVVGQVFPIAPPEQYGSLLRIAANEMGDVNAGQQDEKYISRVNDYRYATKDMEAPQTLESWANMAANAKAWFEKVERGEIPNPYEFEHSNEPDWYNAF